MCNVCFNLGLSTILLHFNNSDIDLKFSLVTQLEVHGWCDVFNKVLVSPASDIDHDHVEKILGEMSYHIKVPLF